MELIEKVFEMRMAIDNCANYEELLQIKADVSESLKDEVRKITELF